ncbi:tyrosine-type recombinase/integrase [Lysobacter enzymogenes]|uniref:tyrosine-type recombinase/integrase n=1 Tax=Lysobacter enzymogenes TaxID=69 RepID=UPI001A9686F4|nr:site-specific integrase [Lysobacter enzymogenes]QQP97946.1 site-specific integrase [Lysobacter enzymogenes]
MIDTKTMPDSAPPAARSTPGSKAVHLDQASVRSLPVPPKEQGNRVYLDDEVDGFCCQVTYKGTRTFRLRYRRAGKWYSVKIGRWREGLGGKVAGSQRGVTAAQARKLAVEIRSELDRGGNPALEARVKAAEQVSASRGAVLLSAAYREYLDYCKTRAKPMADSSREKIEQSFDLHVLPRFSQRYMSSLTSHDVETLAREVGKRRKIKGAVIGGPSAARHAIAHLSAFLTWAVKRKIVAENAAKQIDRADVLEPEKPKARYLSRQEWVAVMAALDEHPYVARRGSRYAATRTVRLDKPQVRQLVSCEALRVALLTGSRKGEVYSMRWSDVDLDSGWWLKPKVKGGKEHGIALAKRAIASLTTLRAAHADPIFAFPGKYRLDAMQSGRKLKGEEGGHVQDVHELWTRIRAELGLPDVRIHDLRHTNASVIVSSGGTLFDVSKQLGHSQAQTSNRYAHLFEERKRELAGMVDSFAEEASKPQKPRRKAG